MSLLCCVSDVLHFYFYRKSLPRFKEEVISPIEFEYKCTAGIKVNFMRTSFLCVLFPVGFSSAEKQETTYKAWARMVVERQLLSSNQISGEKFISLIYEIK